MLFLVVIGAGFIGSRFIKRLIAEGAPLVRVYDNFLWGSHTPLEQASCASLTKVNQNLEVRS